MLTCIVLFGGRGSRFRHSKPKQYFEISGKSLMGYCLDSLKVIKQLHQLVIVCEPTERERVQKIVSEMRPFSNQLEVDYCDSGLQRSDSVLNGLKMCRSTTKYVLIHDGARAFCPQTLLTKLTDNLLTYKGGVVPGLPIVDTIVRIDDQNQNTISQRLDRDKLRRVQTPQGFEYPLILKAYLQGKDNNFEGTDCSSYFLKIGYEVRVIEGSEENVKITTPKDIEIATNILRSRKALGC